MIGASGEDRRRAVELLGEHDPGQHVRPDHRAEGNGPVGLSPQIGIYPVSPTDHQEEVATARIPLMRDGAGEVGTAQRPAAFVHNPERCPVRHRVAKTSCLLLRPTARPVLDLGDITKRQAQPSAGPFEPRQVIVDELPLGSAAQAADGSDVKPHAALYWAVPAGIHIFSSW